MLYNIQGEVRKMKCALIRNKYYTNKAGDYCFARLKKCFDKLGVQADVCFPAFMYDNGQIKVDAEFDFAVSFAKDVKLIKAIEKSGKKVYNSADCIAVCDDKESTFSVVSNILDFPTTIPSPQYFPVSHQPDLEFLHEVGQLLDYPLIIKENAGSLGEQVYLIKNEQELISKHTELLHIPHIFQKFIRESAGSDIRVYIVGGKPYVAVNRYNARDFRSNVSLGGMVKPIRLTPELIDASTRGAKALGLFFGSIDFLPTKNGPLFLEANSNAYFMGIEQETGVLLAEAITEAVVEDYNG